jgi:hypothetical protein
VGVWLQPFFPSPMRDNGYDITDYYGVDPRLGTLGDFVEFSRSARDARPPRGDGHATIGPLPGTRHAHE